MTGMASLTTTFATAIWTRAISSMAAPSPNMIRNQFGGGVGGSIVKNRTFFYVITIRCGNSPALEPTGYGAHGGRTRRRSFSAGHAGRESLTRRRLSPATGFRLAMIDPLAAKILAMYPLPNLPGTVGNYLAQPIGQTIHWQFNGRLDQRLTDRDQLTLRYSYGHNNLYEPYAENSTQVPGYGDYLYDRGHNALIRLRTRVQSEHGQLPGAGPESCHAAAVAPKLPDECQSALGSELPADRSRDYGFPSISVAGLSPVGDVTSLPINRHPTHIPGYRRAIHSAR